MWVICMCGCNDFRVQKSASDSLELKLHKFVSRPMWVLGIQSSAREYMLNYLSSPRNMSIFKRNHLW